MGIKVSAMVMGGQLQTNLEGETVADIKRAVGISGEHTVVMDMSPASDSDAVEDGAYIIFTKAVKGNAKVKTIVATASSVVVQSDDTFKINGIKLSKPQMTKLFKALGKALGYELN